MTSLKMLFASLTVGVALIAGPLTVDAHVIPHKPTAKHVSTKHKIHRKHVKKHVTSKSHKPLATKGLHAKKPLTTHKIAPSKTTAGWHHHSQSL